MSDPKSRIFKRLIREYEFLLEDFNDVAEIHKQANIEMNTELNKHRTQSEFDAEHSQPEIKVDEIEPKHNDKDLKKLFRKIVFVCHPDKVRAEADSKRKADLATYYEQAVTANDEGNWALMVVVAVKLEIELPEEAEAQVEKIQEDARLLKEKIDAMTQSYVWQWYYAEEAKRKEMVDMYLNMLTRATQTTLAPVVQKESKLILGLGHPRTGTVYITKLLQSWGLDVGHGIMGEHGTVDWSLITDDKSLSQDIDLKGFDWQHIIYCVRNPKDSIPSIIELANDSLEFRSKFAGLKSNESPIVQAIKSICHWDLIIQKIDPNIIFRVEDESLDLFNYLKSENVNLTWNEEFLNQKINTKEHKSLDQLLGIYGKPSGRYRVMINAYCERYGYDSLF
jgi:hypothetical protein